MQIEVTRLSDSPKKTNVIPVKPEAVELHDEASFRELQEFFFKGANEHSQILTKHTGYFDFSDAPIETALFRLIRSLRNPSNIALADDELLAAAYQKYLDFLEVLNDPAHQLPYLCLEANSLETLTGLLNFCRTRNFLLKHFDERHGRFYALLEHTPPQQPGKRS